MRVVRFLLLIPFLVSSMLGRNISLVSVLSHRENAWITMKKKLDMVPNSFSLHEPVSFVTQAHATSDYDAAHAYIAVDEASGVVLFEKNSTTKLSIASLTKIMTAVVALDIEKPTDTITISHHAALAVPTKIGVVVGEKMTIKELLEAMLMTSANDAAQAIMDGIDAKYGKHIFISAMNEKARFLGLSKTHFASPQGFDNMHNYSSSHDLAILATYALSHYPLIAQIVQKDYVQLSANTQHKQFDLYNWNGLLDVYPGVDGMKIGNTADAGYTTIVTARRQNDRILVVLLGAPSIVERDLWAAHLLNDSFSTAFSLPSIAISKEALEEKYQTWRYWN